jgi:hypothetical protein
MLVLNILPVIALVAVAMVRVSFDDHARANCTLLDSPTVAK